MRVLESEELLIKSNLRMNSGSKQFWYVIGAIIIVVLLALAIIRGGPASDLAQGTDQAATTSTDEASGGTSSGVSKAFPVGWPADAPALQSGAKITYSGTIDPKTKVAGPTVVYTVSGTPATAVTFFKSQFSKQGWTFRGQGNVLGSVQLAATKDTRKVTVTILETRPGVLNVTIGISKL